MADAEPSPLSDAMKKVEAQIRCGLPEFKAQNPDVVPLCVFITPRRVGSFMGSARIIAEYLTRNDGASILILFSTFHLLEMFAGEIAAFLNLPSTFPPRSPKMTVLSDTCHALCLTVDLEKNRLQQILPIPDKADVVFMDHISVTHTRGTKGPQALTLEKIVGMARQYAWTCASDMRPFRGIGLKNLIFCECTVE